MRIALASLLILAGFGCSATHPPESPDSLASLKTGDGPGGALLVIRDGDVVHAEAFGLADLERHIPITFETNFRLASVTKQFTASAIMLLVEGGQLSLGEPLGDFFSDLPPATKKITIRQLLTHSSGIVAYEDLIPDTATVPVLDRDVLDLVRPVDSTYFQPGTSFRYSNTAYALLALIVEQRSGVSFARFLKQHIFEPAGMDATVAFEKGKSTVRSRAFGYTPDPNREGRFLQTDQSLTSSVLGDGGVYSSVSDLTEWDNALRSNSVLAPSMLREMLTPQRRIDDQGRWYGLGWYIRRVGSDTVYYHGGSTVGFRTCILRIPTRSSLVIALFNRSDANAEAIAWNLAEQYGLIATSEESPSVINE